MSITYHRVRFRDGGRTRTVILRNMELSRDFWSGTEVRRDGAPVEPPGHDERLRIIHTSTITAVTTMLMDLHYGELVPA